MLIIGTKEILFIVFKLQRFFGFLNQHHLLRLPVFTLCAVNFWDRYNTKRKHCSSLELNSFSVYPTGHQQHLNLTENIFSISLSFPFNWYIVFKNVCWLEMNYKEPVPGSGSLWTGHWQNWLGNLCFQGPKEFPGHIYFQVTAQTTNSHILPTAPQSSLLTCLLPSTLHSYIATSNRDLIQSPLDPALTVASCLQ